MGKVICPRKGEVHTTPLIFKPVLNDNSWEQIRAASDAGIASALWNIGDCKKIILNGTVGHLTLTNYETYVYILGFDHNAELEGYNKIHFQLGKTNPSDISTICLIDSNYGTQCGVNYFTMNGTNTNVGGWKSSQMRSNICGTSLVDFDGTMIGVIPEDLRVVLKEVIKYTDNVGNATGSVVSNVTATTEYMFLLSEVEMFNTTNSSNSYEKSYQKRYDYYAAANAVQADSHDGTKQGVVDWLRSPYPTYTFYFALRSSTSSNLHNANYSCGIKPAFCV